MNFMSLILIISNFPSRTFTMKAAKNTQAELLHTKPNSAKPELKLLLTLQLLLPMLLPESQNSTERSLLVSKPVLKVELLKSTNTTLRWVNELQKSRPNIQISSLLLSPNVSIG